MMIIDAAVSAFHYIGFMVVFAALTAMHLSFNDEPSGARSKRMLLLCYTFLGSWVITFATGMIRTFVLAPPELYLKNGLFHLKLTLFFAMILLIAPLFTKLMDDKELPNWIKHTLRVNLLIMLITPILAVLIARGYGFFG